MKRDFFQRDEWMWMDEISVKLDEPKWWAHGWIADQHPTPV